jgi:Ca-activated chloride channel family protein
MPVASALPQPAGTRTTGLVSVDGRAYPLESARIDARAEGGVAVTALTQKYRNPYREPLEVAYTLPLPADGAVIGYTIRLGDKVIRGEVERREEALAAYRDALFEGRAAGLLEQDRADTFTQRLGSLPAGASVEVQIRVLQPLGFLPAVERHPPRWEYRFPTVVGARYEGGEGRVPDADRLDVDRADGQGTLARLDLSLLVADGPPSRLAVHAPAHAISCEADGVGARVALREAARLDRDLVIRWTAAAEEVGLRVVEGPGLEGDGGRYALLTLTPPAAAERFLARDLTILIDASGSMSGQPIGRAKALAAALIRGLDPGDRFEVIAFASQARRLTRGPVEATPNRIRAALAAIESLQAGGATEMAAAIQEALRPLREDAQRQVVLLTDGYIGFEAEVIGHVLRDLPAGSRVHAAGIGSAPNRTLTRGIACAGRGCEVFVGDDRAAAEAAARLRHATARPVLTEIGVAGSALRALAQERPADVFEGQPLVLAVELAPGDGVLEVRGRMAGEREPWTRAVHVPPSSAADPAGARPAGAPAVTPLPLGALFGRVAIDGLELRLSATGDRHEEIEAQIEALGIRHRIASRRTSLVAIAEEPSVDPRAPRRRERLAVEMPAGVSAEGTGLLRGPMEAWRGATVAHSLVAEHRLYKRTSRAELGMAFARILHLDGPDLVIEFEVPWDGFEMPRGTVTVRWSQSLATVDEEASSPPGPHARGLTVRLALRLGRGRRWESRWEILEWTGQGPGGATHGVMVHIDPPPTGGRK